MYLLTGQCHCGNIHIRYQSPVALEEIIGRACGCTYCTRHGAVYASHPDGVLTCEIADPHLSAIIVSGLKRPSFLPALAAVCYRW